MVNKQIFVSCAPGLEESLRSEIQSFGISLPLVSQLTQSSSEYAEEKGGIEFAGFYTDIYKVNLYSRLATRILVRLDEFHASAFSELRKKASRLPWELYLKPGEPVVIKVTCHKSRLYHSGAVAERVLGAIEDHFKQPCKPADEHSNVQMVFVRVVNDMCMISVDTSGELLHRRGYRQAVAKAPLRETLAAGLLALSGWDAKTTLVDPFCGSGTIPIEAALIARQIAPGINRSFAFMNWPSFDHNSFAEMLEKAKKLIQPSTIQIYGSDRDQGAIEMATANAARTGVNQDIQFSCHAISNLPSFPSAGSMITNPPYGVRINSNKDMRNLYASFGKLLRTNFNGWTVGVLCGEEPLLAALELGIPQKKVNLINGGIPVKFAIYKIT